MGRWRSWKSLVHDAVDATTGLVREGNEAAQRNVRRVTDRLEPVAGPARAVGDLVALGTRGTLGTVVLVNRVVETLTDLALDASPAEIPPDEPPLPMRSDLMGTAAWVADAAVGAVNGAVGHHLAARRNGLDLGMTLRHEDRYLDPDDPALAPSGTLVVLVHGLGTTEWCWNLDALAYHGDAATNLGTVLAKELGATSVFARYNSGRAVAANGRALADAIDRLVAGAAVQRIVLIGHSMGGLVVRAACRSAREAGQAWVDRVDLVVSLGTPHQGAPLARLGAAATEGLGAVDLPATRVLSRLLAGRSAGIRDLELGDVSEVGRDPDATAAPEERVVPLLDGVRYAFLSATVTEDPSHPVGRWVGDLLVREGSASGPVQVGSFPIRTATFGGVMHHQLQCHPAVFAEVLRLVRGDGA